MQASPAGVWSSPRHLIINTSAVELYWDQPSQPNGYIVQYRLIRDGFTVFTGDHEDQSYTDIGLLPKQRYFYELEASTEGGSGVSDKYVVETPVSCPTGIPLPYDITLSAIKVTGPESVEITWRAPEFPNGIITGYELRRDGEVIYVGSETHYHDFTLVPSMEYSYVVIANNSRGAVSSEVATAKTHPSAPSGVGLPIVTPLKANQPNGRVLHYEVHRRPHASADANNTDDAATVVFRNVSMSYKDRGLQPYTLYQYQVWAVNSAGYAASPWVSGRTGPAPPEGVDPPIFLHVSATSAVVEIHPPAQPNGIVGLYRVFSLDHNTTTLTLLSEGTSLQQTLHDLRPFTQYWVGIEACTCYQCCSRGPLRELNTLAAAPANQPPPRLVTLTSRSVQMEWDEPLAPNGVIESLDSNLTVIWLDWTRTFSLNGYLKEYTVTESQLRVYTGFYSYLHIPRTSQKTLSFQVTCTTDSGSASTPTIRYSPATGLDPLEPIDSDKQGVSMSATPVYSELWFILLFALLGLTDTKIVSSSSHFGPMSVLRAPSPTDLNQAYSQHSLHGSVSQLIDRKTLMMEEGCWNNPMGHDSGLYLEDDDLVDTIKTLSSVKKEHAMFTDTHL
uniref:Usher syndrome 2A (Autosomal recessive, mild) n=2 Tax=Nothobranchius kadleci TaxID=1051664 RepID=A0A1A8CGD6_NOTKA